MRSDLCKRPTGQHLDLRLQPPELWEGSIAVRAAQAGTPAAAGADRDTGCFPLSICQVAVTQRDVLCLVSTPSLRFASLGRGMASALPGNDARPGFGAARAGRTGAACSARTPGNKGPEAPDSSKPWTYVSPGECADGEVRFGLVGTLLFFSFRTQVCILCRVC